MQLVPSGSLLIRTWFGEESAWNSLIAQVTTASEDGFLANITLVDDQDFAGFSATALREQQLGGASVSFIADETTLASPEAPILAVWMEMLEVQVDQTDVATLRVIPSELWAVENNLNLANMDWWEFVEHCDPDGIFRGV